MAETPPTPASPAIIDAASVVLPALALSIPAAAKCAGVSPRTMAQFIADARIRSFKLGSRRLISLEALKAFIAQAEAANGQ